MDPNFLHAKLEDSDSEDDDYVPNDHSAESHKDKKGAAAKQQVKEEVDEDNLTGIAGLKAMKRKNDINDLWASM